MFLVVLSLVVAGCAAPDVPIIEATRSLDGERVELLLDSCNDQVEVRVQEGDDRVEVAVTRPGGSRLDLAGGDCQDRRIVELDEGLGSRTLVDEARGGPVEVARPDEQRVQWPYDRSRVSEAQYVRSLRAMVECLETRDPQVEAWVAQGLNWKTYRWSKPADEEGNTRMPALRPCRQEHLEPLM